MISSRKETFIKNSVSVDSVSDTVVLDYEANSLIFEVNGTGQFSVRFETSPNGTDWYGIQELDAFSADTIQSLSNSINIFRYLRAKIDIGTTGSVTICKIHYRKD